MDDAYTAPIRLLPAALTVHTWGSCSEAISAVTSKFTVFSTLGATNDVVTVKDGYFMNFLLPRGLAGMATSEALAAVQTKISENESAKAEALSAAMALKEKIESSEAATVSKKAGDRGAIFGSVTPAEVVAALGLKGSPKISFDSISSIGSYDVKVSLHPKVTATAKLRVVAE